MPADSNAGRASRSLESNLQVALAPVRSKLKLGL
jgi:hypothetical protein